MNEITPKEGITGSVAHSPLRSFWSNIYAPEGRNRKISEANEAIVCFVIKGTLKVSVESFDNRTVQLGEAFLIPPATPFEVEILRDAHVIACRFNMSALLSAHCPVAELLPFCKEITYDFNLLETNGILTMFLSLMEDYLLKSIDSYYFFELKTQELFYLLFSSYSKESLAAFLYPIVGEDIAFQEFIINNCLNVRNVQELAALAHYSTSGFIKRFRRCFNESPYKWIARRKAERIRLDILSGTKSLQEISHQHLFSSYPRFVHFCKTQMGVLPSEIATKR